MGVADVPPGPLPSMTPADPHASFDPADPAKAPWVWARISLALRLVDGLDQLEHDLRSPLQSLLMAVELLDRGSGGGARRLIDGATERVERVLGGLDFPDYGRVEPEPLSLREVVEAVVRFWPVRRALGPLVPALDLPASLPAVRCSDAALRVALVQLLCNAGEALAGAQQPQLWVTARRLGEVVRLELRDNGPGIAPADRGRVFDWFYTTRTAPERLGLGLGLARELLQRSGARVAVGEVGEGGSGAVLVLELPALG